MLFRSADSVFADGSVTAGNGIHAGVPGSTNPTAGISTLGGLNVGTPGPTVPGTINATVAINAGVSVFGPTVSDMFGPMELFRTKVDTHVHLVPDEGGMITTTPPTMPME